MRIAENPCIHALQSSTKGLNYTSIILLWNIAGLVRVDHDLKRIEFGVFQIEFQPYHLTDERAQILVLAPGRAKSC